MLLQTKHTVTNLLAGVLVIFTTLLLQTHVVSAQFVPVGQPGSELYYQYQRRLRAGVTGFESDPQLAPYVQNPDRSAADITTNTFHWWPSANNTLRWFVAPEEKFNVSGDTSSTAREILRGGASVRLSERFSAISAFALDETKAKDPAYGGKIWRGLAGDVETAAVLYHNSNVSAMFGRFRASWGPNYTNPLLSQTAEPFDGLALRYKPGKRLTYSYQLARLDGFSPDSDTSLAGSVFINRYFAAHRVDLHLSERFRLGLFETIIFAGPGRSLELQFLNPLNFFHANQLNEDNNDNTFLGFDFDWQVAKSAVAYGQVVVDDFQIENKTQGDQEPSELGLQFGADLINLASLAKDWDLLLRWDKVTNRTYNQKLDRNRYLNANKPIGHPLGNDFELFTGVLRNWISPATWISAEGSYLRKGEGRISDIWSEPWLSLSGDYQEPFPTGVVEQTLRFSLGYQTLVSLLRPAGKPAPPSTVLQGLFKVEVGWENIENLGHISGAGGSNPFLSARISLFFAGEWGLN